MIDLNTILFQIDRAFGIPPRTVVQFDPSGANKFEALGTRAVAQFGERTRQTDSARNNRMQPFHLVNGARGDLKVL